MELNNEVSPDISSDLLGPGTADEVMNEDISHGGDALNSEVQDPGTGNLDEDVAEKPESTALSVAENSETMANIVADSTEDMSSNNQDLGIDDEMKAMFGDDSTPEVSALENVHDSEHVGGDIVEKPVDQSNDEPPPMLIKHDQILDDSNLEDMMEALHADKVEPLHTVQKQAETSGLELKDVLQALTGDLEEGSSEIGDKQKNKDNGDAKSVKRRTEVEMLKESTVESDGSAERILRDRSKQNINTGSGKKTASDRKSQSVKKSKGRKASDSEEEECSSDEEEKSQSKTRGKSDKKKDQADADDSSDSGDSKPKKPVTRKTHKKSDDSKDQKGSQNSKTPRRKPGPKSARLKSTEGDSDSDEENSSDPEDNKQKKPTTTKVRQKPDDSKDLKGSQNSKTPRRKPGPKSVRSKSTEGNSDSDEENSSSDSEDSKQKKPTTTKARQKLDDSKDQKGSQNSKTPRRKPGPKSARSKSAEGDSVSNEENSSDSEDNKLKKSTTKTRKTSEDSKEQEKELSHSKPLYRKPGPKSARSKSTECDSESDDEKTPGQKSAKSRKGRKPLPGTDLVSKSNKVCIITDCRQQCFPQLGISLHRFPVGPSSIRKFWLKLVSLEPPGPTTAYICSKHFTENDYNYDAKKDPSDTFYRKLKPGAIPSVGIPVKDKMLQKVKAEVEIWKKTEMKAAMEASIENDSDRKKKPGRPHEKSGGAEVKVEPLTCGDSQEEEEGEGDSKDKTGQPGAGPAKALPASVKPTKDQGEETKKGVAKEGSEKVKRTASRSPSPSSTTLQPSLSARTPAPMIRKRPETETRGRTPGTNCSVPCCGNNLFETRAEGLNISYYRFPFDNDLADRWIRKIGDLGLNARTARICSDHFADKDFDGTGGGRRNLKPKAVPSLYLTEKKPRERDSNEEAEEEDRTISRKRSKSKGGGLKKNKPDTSFISMPLPIVDDIKSEPPTDDETVGQDYAPSDPGSEPEEPVPAKKMKIEKVGNKELFEGHGDDDSNDKEVDSKRPRGRPRKDSSSSGSPNVKTVSLASLALPIVSLERLGKRVIDAADSGSLRVRIKESDKAAKPAPKPKPGPKSKRKRVDSDTETSPANRVVTRPGPLSKKNMLAKLDNTFAGPKRFGPKKKVLKMSDNESDSDIDNPPSPMSTAENDISEPPSNLNTTTNALKVKPAELPKFLQEKPVTEENLVEDGLVGDDMMLLGEPLAEDLDSILDSDKSDKEKIIQLVEQRISEHTKIIEGKTMGAQQLADHNKILQGSALVLKKLAEKSGKPAVIPMSIPDGSTSTPGRTIVLRKVSDPSRLGLKPPSGRVATSKDSSPSSPSKSPLPPISPLNSARSTPSRLSKIAQGDDSNDGKACSPLEKIREYDNLMKKYLSAVLDKNLMSKKYTECKEAQKALEIKLNERNKELEMAKRKISTLQAKINRTNNALEYFLTPNQIKLALQETKKVAWSPEEMLTAFTIKHLSKACYLFLRHKLNYPLPGISSLQRWMTMLSKDKAEDDEDNIADEDVSDKEESQEILEEGPGVVNEITGTLEEINACGAPGEENYHPEEGGEHVKDSNQSSPFQVVFENDGNSNSNRKVIILKKMPKGGNGKMKLKSKLQISASENDVNVSNIEESDEKNELYKLLPGAKTISMASSPLGSQKRNRFVVPKKIKEQEKISFQRLPQVRKDMSVPKPPRIQIVKNEPQEEYVNQQYDESLDPNSEGHVMQVAASDLVETVVKPEMVMHTNEEQQGESPQKFFTISDLNSSQMEEHIVENVEHMTEDGQIVHKVEGGEVMHETIMSGEGVQNITIVKEDGVVEHHSGQAIEGMMAMAGDQQITFATTEDMGRAHHFAQIAYAQGNHGEITLHEDINNMTAVVINDIDEEQLNTLLLSNVVEQKGVEIQGEQAYGHKKIIYQTIDHDKNVIVLQPDSQAFIEEDEGTSGGAPRVYIINDEGHIVSTPGSDTTALAQEIGFIDSSAFAEIQSLGYKLSGDPDQSYTIGNLIENYAIASPTKASKKS